MKGSLTVGQGAELAARLDKIMERVEAAVPQDSDGRATLAQYLSETGPPARTRETMAMQVVAGALVAISDFVATLRAENREAAELRIAK